MLLCFNHDFTDGATHQPQTHLAFYKKQNIWGDLIALLKKHIFAAFGFFVEFCYLFSGKQNSNSSSVDALRQAL